MMRSLSLSEIASYCDGVLLGSSIKTNAEVTNINISNVFTDTRTPMPDGLFVALNGERFDAHDYVDQAQEQGAVALLVEREVVSELPQIIVSDTVTGLGQVAHLVRRDFTGGLAAITGSCGKTTVKQMLAAIAAESAPVLATSGNLNNHIGVPLTLLQLAPEHRYAVIEMGASAVGEINYLSSLGQPSVAVVTNVMPAHVEGFGSVDAIAATKADIYQHLQTNGMAIINIDDHYAPQWLTQLNELVREKAISFVTVSMKDSSADWFVNNCQLHADGSQFQLHHNGQTIAVQLPLMGQHNIHNALIAAALASAMGLTDQHIATGLEKAANANSRLTRLAGIHGAHIIDDSYNANPDSVKAAIDVLAEQPGTHRWLVLGDMGELGSDANAMHADVGRYALEKGIENIMTVGELSVHTAEAAGERGRHFDDQQSLIHCLKTLLTTDSTVLIKGSRSSHMEVVRDGLVVLGEQ